MYNRMTELAIELMKLGVSETIVGQLLSTCELDEIERQLAYLPYRKAKRPAAFIVDAIRKSYSPPKEFYYASHKAYLEGESIELDETSQPCDRSPDADPEGHGAPGAPGCDPADDWVESDGSYAPPDV